MKKTIKKSNKTSIIVLIIFMLIGIIILVINLYITYKEYLPKIELFEQIKQDIVYDEDKHTISVDNVNGDNDAKWETPISTEITPGVKGLLEKSSDNLKYEPLSVIGIQDNTKTTRYRVLCKNTKTNEYVLLEIYVDEHFKPRIVDISEFKGDIKKYTKN